MAENRTNSLADRGQILWQITAGRLMHGGMWSILYILLDKTREHKADYVPSSEAAARGKKDGRAGGYVESWQGVRRRGEGRGFGLKSRINLKIRSKNGLRWRWGFGPMKARFYRHHMGWQSASRHGKSLRVYALTGCL